jgi:hypothetical protein
MHSFVWKSYSVAKRIMTEFRAISDLMVNLTQLESLPLSHRFTIPLEFLDLMGHMKVRWYMAPFLMLYCLDRANLIGKRPSAAPFDNRLPTFLVRRRVLCKA